MAKITANYEVVYIIDPAQGEEAIAAAVAKFQTLAEQNGTNVVVDEWGTRRLAYAIDYKTEGWYVLVNFKAPVELPRELERNLQINERVLRYLVVKQEEKRSAVKPRAVKPAPVAAPAEEAAPAEAAPAAAEAPAEAAAPAAEEAPAEAE